MPTTLGTARVVNRRAPSATTTSGRRRAARARVQRTSARCRPP